MSLSHRLEQCYSGAVFDVMRAMGRRNCVLPADIRPLNPMRRLAGPIYTISGHRDETLDDHQTLLGWTGLLSKVPANSVVVCQPNDNTMSHMGELSSETLLLRGIRGYIVDGGCRDSDFILRNGFRVFCKYFTPRDVVGAWIPDAFGQAITIGGVCINNGDYVIADRDGAVVIPAELAEEVTAESEKVMNTESLVRKAILNGEDPQKAYLQFGKF